jgi:hypothetical protein
MTSTAMPRSAARLRRLDLRVVIGLALLLARGGRHGWGGAAGRAADPGAGGARDVPADKWPASWTCAWSSGSGNRSYAACASAAAWRWRAGGAGWLRELGRRRCLLPDRLGVGVGWQPLGELEHDHAGREREGGLSVAASGVACRGVQRPSSGAGAAKSARRAPRTATAARMTRRTRATARPREVADGNDPPDAGGRELVRPGARLAGRAQDPPIHALVHRR